MRDKIKPYASLIVALLLILLALPAAAQESDEALVLSLSRNFGYGGGNRIQGTFSLKATGPEDLVRVEFLIDGEVVATDEEAPYRYQFNTASYAVGSHTFSAQGYTADGSQISSNQFSREMISSQRAWDDVRNILVPLLLVIAVLAVLGTLGSALFGRKKEHKPGEYGMAGGTVCRRCGFPFSRNFLSPNLMVGKLVRCPHCGKWGILPRASAAELEAAEARLAQESQGTLEAPSEEQRLRRMLDESRFDD
jgi:hypothetical protein